LKKLKLYLDTSVYNFIFADEVPEMKQLTIDFFNKVGKGEYEVFASDLVVTEIGETSVHLRR